MCQMSFSFVHLLSLSETHLPPVIHLHIFSLFISSIHLFSFFFQHFPFGLSEVFSLILISLFSRFSSLSPCWFVIGCAVSCGLVCHGPVPGVSPAVGGSLWSLGWGSAPPGPPAPGRLHRSISWAGTVHHMCAPTPPSLTENAWGSVFLPTCTIQWSASTNWMFLFHHHTAFSMSPLWQKNMYIILYFS